MDGDVDIGDDELVKAWTEGEPVEIEDSCSLCRVRVATHVLSVAPSPQLLEHSKRGTPTIHAYWRGSKVCTECIENLLAYISSIATDATEGR